MWYPIRDYTLAEARTFLRDDFSKVIRRTRYLYVDAPQRADLGHGFFEPVQLALCWCDFLGALYAGTTAGGNQRRIEAFLDHVLGGVNSDYRAAMQGLVQCYRHGTVHAYAPAGSFLISVPDVPQHLHRQGDLIVLSVARLLDDMLRGVERFAAGLTDASGATGPGTLAAFNAGRSELG
jgi:hypothetical protein